MAQNFSLDPNLDDFDADEEEITLPLKRTFSLGSRRHRERDVKILIQQFERLKKENKQLKKDNKLFKDFIFDTLKSERIAVSCTSLQIGETNIMLGGEESVGRMKLLIEDLVTNSAKHALECEQMKVICFDCRRYHNLVL